ncbi:MAG: hypothetical protein QM727_09110 [Niabella sp.]
MRKTIWLFLLLLSTIMSYGQTQETIYLNAEDSTVNMFIAVKPKDNATKAFMFLIPGAFQTPMQVLQQSDLPVYAAKNGILTIIPLFQTGIYSFGIDSLTQQSLDNQIKFVTKKYKLENKKLFIGGFSIGGSNAVKYAELFADNPGLSRPKAVFAIDPPLDFERYYNAAKRVFRLTPKGQVNEEVTYMIERIEKEMGGTPQTALENFYTLSPYSYSDEKQRAVKKLTDIPITIYSEPDIHWWLSQRGYDYSFMNITDQAAMINELQRLGNKKAVLVTTENKGFRKPDGIRHPHSFSIVYNEQLITWLLEQ